MAALASSRQTAPPIQQPTPPSSSHGGRGSWDFAVPVNNLRESLDHDRYMSEYGAHQSYNSQANDFAQPIRSPTWDSHDLGRSQLVPDRVNELHKKKSGEMIASNSDQDSVLEYYKTHTNNKRGPASIKGKPKKKSAKGSQTDPEYDEDHWIHRDKLKEIETRELEEAGFRVGRSSRSNSRRSQSTSRRARDRTNSESTERTQNGDERPEPRKRVSTIPAGDEEAYEDDYHHHHTGSPASPGETVEFQPMASKGNHTVRPSTSRIPLPKTSGIPVPASVAERDAPLPRSRSGSAHMNGDSIATMGARVRSGSVGSQVLLDDYDDGQDRNPRYGGHRRNTSTGSMSPPKSPQKSPVKGKAPTKPNAASSRKTSVQKKQTKPRTTSNTSPPNKRPGTSGNGITTRPTTAHRPEGEAPWIASMYKPDPRLPPDQQIIPTHAKRMQQEQWENEGRVGSMYDKDFRLLNDDDMMNKRLSQLDPIAIEKARQEEAWPLPSPTKTESSPLDKADTNTAKSPTMEQNAYKLTPTIPQGVDRAPSPKMAPPISPPQPKSEVTRVPEPTEEPKEKKGMCCIVM